MKRDMGLDGFCLSQMKRNERINILYNKVQEDIKNNNVYKGKTLAEIKDFIYRDKNIENTDLLYSILIHVNDIEFFLKLLSRKNLTRLEEILEETKDSEPLEEWMFS